MEGLLGSNSWLYIIFIGFIVGVLARFLKPGRDGMGIILTILFGGAFLIGLSLRHYKVTDGGVLPNDLISKLFSKVKIEVKDETSK